MTSTVLPKLGILASGNGSNLEAIAQAIELGQIQAQISVMIYNNPEAKARERAQRYGISAVLINHRHFQERESFDQTVLNTLKSYQVDWVIMAGWMRRATEILVDGYPGRILNIHPSLLPSFPGVHAVEQALNYGVKITGCTVHLVTLEVDRGPILTQAAVPVLQTDTVATLHARIQEQEHRILSEAIQLCLQP